MTAKLTTDNALFGHTDENSAYLVDDYPYGFRLRTKIRYWLETTKHGDRFCSQTLNPKTGLWNKPKKSTYAPVGVMMRDENDHITWTALKHHPDDEWLAQFRTVVAGHLNAQQLNHLAAVIGVKNASKYFTVSIHEGEFTPEDEAKQEAVKAEINRIARIEIGKARGELEG